MIPPDTTGWTDEEIDALAAKTEEVENKMVAVLAAAEEADADLARVLTAATGGDPEIPAEQGTNDGQSLQDGQLTPEEMGRLEENTTLTPEQQEALVRGDLVLPASQMAYLNNLSRSLDGKSPAEIRAMIDQLNQNGQNGDAVTDALQLLGNEHITTAGADPDAKPGDAGYVPTQGGMQSLPSGIRETFERPTRGPAVPTQGTNEQGNPTIEMPDVNIRSRSWKTTATSRRSCRQAIPRCSRAPRWTRRCSTSRSRSCTACTARRTPRCQKTSKCSRCSSTRRCRTCCPPAERDQMAVHGALTGPENGRVRRDLFKHQWADDGAAAGTLLNGTGAVPTDLTDPTQIEQATRAGETMHAVDKWVGENAPKLLDIESTGNQSLGQVNPSSPKPSPRPTSPTSTTCSAIRSTTAGDSRSWSKTLRTARCPLLATCSR